MLKFTWSSTLLAIACAIIPQTALALPGQSRAEVISWISSNPTLRPALGDGLSVRKFNTAAQRFSFEASVLPVSSLINITANDVIRKEQISFYDLVNGVTVSRLEESLRVIYGADIYFDYVQARVIYQYPTLAQIELSRRQNLPLLSARQGELRLGNRFAYWYEITAAEGNPAANGQITIFLREDLDRLEVEIRNRI